MGNELHSIQYISFNNIDVYDAHATNLGKSDSWREVSKTIFACNLQLLKIDP